MEVINLNGENLSISEVIAVANNYAKVEIDYQLTKERILASRNFIEKKVSNDEIVYGVTTGFGPLVNTKIDQKDTIKLQQNLLISHATGIGTPLSTLIVRAIMVIRLNTFLQGYSGVRIELIEQIQNFINHKIHPIIPSQGSVGASGDLCPLSHLGSALIGYGKVEYKGQIISANDDSLPVKPIQLSYKEGLAINNGTTLMAALGVQAVHESYNLIELATKASCIVYEALGARRQSFHPSIHSLRRNKAQQKLNENINALVSESEMIGITSKTLINLIPDNILNSWEKELLTELQEISAGKRLTLSERAKKQIPLNWEKYIEFSVGKAKPQDSYSLRCIPQVFGASLNAIQHAESVIENELNAVVDNPIILAEEERVVSGGNFHGQPLALVLDYLKIAIAEIGSILERQITKLVDDHHNYGLPPFLIDGVGLNSGMMITQYLAASLVSENKVLAHPASIDTIPTSNNQEDHVSMGPIAGRQALEILDNVEKILAVHLLNAAQALDLRKKQFSELNLPFPEIDSSSKALHLKVREKVDFLTEDIFLHESVNTMYDFVKSQALVLRANNKF